MKESWSQSHNHAHDAHPDAPLLTCLPPLSLLWCSLKFRVAQRMQCVFAAVYLWNNPKHCLTAERAHSIQYIVKERCMEKLMVHPSSMKSEKLANHRLSLQGCLCRRAEDILRLISITNGDNQNLQNR